MSTLSAPHQTFHPKTPTQNRTYKRSNDQTADLQRQSQFSHLLATTIDTHSVDSVEVLRQPHSQAVTASTTGHLTGQHGPCQFHKSGVWITKNGTTLACSSPHNLLKPRDEIFSGTLRDATYASGERLETSATCDG